MAWSVSPPFTPLPPPPLHHESDGLQHLSLCLHYVSQGLTGSPVGSLSADFKQLYICLLLPDCAQRPHPLPQPLPRAVLQKWKVRAMPRAVHVPSQSHWCAGGIAIVKGQRWKGWPLHSGLACSLKPSTPKLLEILPKRLVRWIPEGLSMPLSRSFQVPAEPKEA